MPITRTHGFGNMPMRTTGPGAWKNNSTNATFDKLLTTSSDVFNSWCPNVILKILRVQLLRWQLFRHLLKIIGMSGNLGCWQMQHVLEDTVLITSLSDNCKPLFTVMAATTNVGVRCGQCDEIRRCCIDACSGGGGHTGGEAARGSNCLHRLVAMRHGREQANTGAV